MDKAVEKNPLMMVAAYDHRELVYHPQKLQEALMYQAMENSPPDY